MKKLLVLTVLLVTGACTPPPVESPADRAISHWVGRPVAALIGSWGPPTEETIEGERHLYIWEATQYGHSTSPANLPEETYWPYPGGRENFGCRGVVEVDDQGKVIAADWQGYECHHLP